MKASMKTHCALCDAECFTPLMQGGLCPRCFLVAKEAEWRAKAEEDARLRKEDYAQYPTDDPFAVDYGNELLERLPRLLNLCHPDKHDNSIKATEITQWLLDIRRRSSRRT